MLKAKQRAMIAIRVTREYNALVGELCHLLGVNRPELFRRALLFYLAKSKDLASAIQDGEVARRLKEAVMWEDSRIKRNKHYTPKPIQSKQQ